MEEVASLAVRTVQAPLKVVDERGLIDRFIADCVLRGMSPETIRGYRSNLLIYLSYMQRSGESILKADKETLRRFLQYLKAGRGVSMKRVENYFSSLSSFYDYLAYEDMADRNPVLPVRKRYLRSYKEERNVNSEGRKLISVEEMSMLVNSILNVRDRALVTLLAKTGIRKGELIAIDLEDIDWEGRSITLKPRAKRSNRLVFFDEETARVLQSWFRARERMQPKSNALFLGETGERLNRNGVYTAVTRWAARVGLHDPKSEKPEHHFMPHCCRHWFTTHLRRAGMPREFIQELRGDKRRGAIDIYDHIDKEELRRAYLAFMPQLGV